MSFGAILSGVAGGLANLGSAWASFKGVDDNKKVNDLNFQLQKENLDYQRSLQDIIFKREDNAVQRRVNDLLKAGLSPTLAAGSAAGNGPVVSTRAAQKVSDFEGYMALATVGTMLAQQQKAQTEADIARQNLEQVRLDTKYLKERGIAPVEVKQDWQQRLVNLLYPKIEQWLFGKDTKSGATKELIDALDNFNMNLEKRKNAGSSVVAPQATPSPFPYETARAVRYNGEKLTDKQYDVLKKAGLFNTWVKEGFANRKVSETLARYAR